MLQQNELHFMVQCTVCGTQFTYDPQTNECVETHAAKSESQLAFTEWKGSACSCPAGQKALGLMSWQTLSNQHLVSLGFLNYNLAVTTISWAHRIFIYKSLGIYL